MTITQYETAEEIYAKMCEQRAADPEAFDKKWELVLETSDQLELEFEEHHLEDINPHGHQTKA